MAFNFGQAPSAPTGFGAAATAPKPTGLFGASLAPAASAAPAFGGFGSTPASSAPAFGAAGATSASPFGTSAPAFGAAATSAPGFGTISTASPFGAATSTAPFGASTTTSLFGAKPATTGTTSLFNNTTNTSSSIFGAKPSAFGTSSSLFASAGPNMAIANNVDAMTPEQRQQLTYQLLVRRDRDEKMNSNMATLVKKADNPWQALALMKSWWDHDSPTCRFKTYFYNKVAPHEVHLYQRPPHHDQKEWDDAQKKNPDPTCMVPTLAVGFKDLNARTEAQSRQSQAHRLKLKELDDRLQAIRRDRITANQQRIDQIKADMVDQIQRVIQFLKHTQVIRQKGLAITQEEEIMRTSYEALFEQMNESEQYKSILSEQWAQIQLIKEASRVGSAANNQEWINIPQAQVDHISHKFDQQQRGIQQLVDVLQKDLEVANTHLAKLHSH
ncbi:nucleoporin complex subunit 54-domain-containing protein [Gongronella butleri]|nr:nucleoporin complex subunit 54-domain-containing protein [Gongronella butleri]